MVAEPVPVLSQDLSDRPFHGVSSDCRFDTPGHFDSQSLPRPFIPHKTKQNQIGTAGPLGPSDYQVEFGFLLDPYLSGESLFLHGGNRVTVRLPLDPHGQPFSSLGPPSAQHLSSILGGHPLSETMISGSLDLRRLIGSLHSRSLSAWMRFNSSSEYTIPFRIGQEKTPHHLCRHPYVSPTSLSVLRFAQDA
jgi:hypothetical protein